jgi:hypothetical protein
MHMYVYIYTQFCDDCFYMPQNVNRVCIKAGTEGKARLMLPFTYAESSGLMQKFTMQLSIGCQAGVLGYLASA